jgi:hypothetical protein
VEIEQASGGARHERTRYCRIEVHG